MNTYINYRRQSFYRFFEILPGFLVWSTFFLIFFLSWRMPVWIAIFIILFDLFWLFRTIYLFALLRFTLKASSANMKEDWLMKCRQLETKDRSWQDIYHLVILPMHKESYEVVLSTFESLVRINYPKEKLIVVLGIEERAGTIDNENAEKIKAQFKERFFKLLITEHPSNLLDEISGKGSNATWAAQKAKAEIIDPLKIPYENIIVSLFDVDSQVASDYFGRLTHSFLTVQKPQRSSFQPVPFFTNNIYDASPFSRIVAFSTSFWQMMQQSRPENMITFSSHSMPFKALVEIGFWQKDIVSEDSRIFWQCYVHYKGDWRVEPLFYPIYMDANVAPTFWGTLVNIYKQQRRWAWGSENIAYILTSFIKEKGIPKRLYWTFHTLEGFYSWATASIIILTLGWLPIILGGASFKYTLLSFNLPELTSLIMRFSAFGIITCAILSVVLLPPRPTWFKSKHYLLYIFEWLFTPLVLIFLGSIPAIDAQTRLMLGGKLRLGFWVTPKVRFKQKPA